MTPTPEELRRFCVAVLSWVGPLLLARQETARVLNKDVSNAGWLGERMAQIKSAVTTADLESQERILDAIHRAFPDHAVLFEEDAPAEAAKRFPKDGPFLWLVDPLDGTLNYAEGSPHFGAILGVADLAARRPVAGAFIEPAFGRTFSFAAGRGAFLGDEPITIRRPADRAPVLIGYQVPDALSAALEAEGYAWRRAYRCLATAASSLLRGEGAALIMCNTDVLDAAAPLAVIQAARGHVTDWSGVPFADWLAPRFHTILATGEPLLQEELAGIASHHLRRP